MLIQIARIRNDSDYQTLADIGFGEAFHRVNFGWGLWIKTGHTIDGMSCVVDLESGAHAMIPPRAKVIQVENAKVVQ
jgi:hypothetical protein